MNSMLQEWSTTARIMANIGKFTAENRHDQ